MNITLNGAPQEVRAILLDEILAEIGLADAVVATAVNGRFVAAAARPEIRLNDGDLLEVVAPRQGG